jgi:hypothetical protein
MWADTDEAAVLSGMAPEKFRAEVKKLEAKGFPQVNPINGKRSIPAILAFWKLETNDFPTLSADSHAEDEDERNKEKWPN